MAPSKLDVGVEVPLGSLVAERRRRRRNYLDYRDVDDHKHGDPPAARHNHTTVAGGMQQLVIQPGPATGVDTFLTAPGNPNDNWGSLTALWVGFDERNAQRPLVRFDLSPRPPTVTVVSCLLSVVADTVESPLRPL